MGFIKLHQTAEFERKSVSDGEHDGLLHAIIEYGVQRQEFKGEEKPPKNVIKLIFEVPGEGLIGLGDVTTTLHEKGKLFKTFKSMGIVKTTQELESVLGSRESVEGLLGTTVKLVVESMEKEDRRISFISSLTALDKRLPQPEAELEPFIFSFDNPDLEVFKTKVTAYGRKKIMSALNAKDLPKPFHDAYIAELDAAEEKSKLSAGKKKASIKDK